MAASARGARRRAAAPTIAWRAAMRSARAPGGLRNAAAGRLRRTAKPLRGWQTRKKTGRGGADDVVTAGASMHAWQHAWHVGCCCR
jgi:hypothetical protein